jgi:hypothetical protein
VLLLALLLGSAPVGWLPYLANALVRKYLDVRDLPDIRVRVERLSPWQLQAALQLGTNAPASHLNRLTVRFSPSGLYHRRIDRVELSDGLLQFQADSNGLVCCGVPQDLERLRLARSPLADDEEETTTRHPWQVGSIVLDRLTLRLLPPENRRAAEPYDLCLQAAAIAGPEELRILMADYGRTGTQGNGALRPETGDGWFVVTLPESQVQEWLRVAQWYISDPRGQGRDLCAGNGGGTFLLRLEQWRPALFQVDLSLRAATRWEALHLTGDLRVHGLARWLPEDEGRPTLEAQADLRVRMASAAGIAVADDRELPAQASVAVQAFPHRAEWDCRLSARLQLSHEAVRACLPSIAERYHEALGVRLDGALTTPDWQLWNGSATAMLLDAPAGWGARDGAWRVQDLLAQATAYVTNSMLAAVRAEATARWSAEQSAAVTGRVRVAVVTVPPFDQAQLAATVRVDHVALPAGTLGWDPEHPPQASLEASLRRTPQGVAVAPVQLSVCDTPLQWISGTGEELRGVLAAGGSAAFGSSARWQAQVCLTGVQVRAEDFTGGVESLCLRLRELPVEPGRDFPAGTLAQVTLSNGWLRTTDDSVQLDGLRLAVPLSATAHGVQSAGAPALAWDRLSCEGLFVSPESLALTTGVQAVSAYLQVGVPQLGLHPRVAVKAAWSNTWVVQANAELPAAIVADDEGVRTLLQRWTGAELSLTGQVAATAALTLAAGKPPALRLQAAVTNLDVGGLADPWQVSGIAATVALDGPRGWRTPQGQVLSFRSAKKGSLVTQEGRVQWQYRRDAFLVEQADLQWCRGALHAYGVTYNIHNPDFNCVLYADKIHLGDMMAQTRTIRGSGEANLFGRIPLSVQNGMLRVTESYLHTSPGEEGVLKVNDERLMDTALPMGSMLEGVREKLRDGLRNLKLSVFRVGLSGSGTNAVLRVSIAGRPAEDNGAPPLELNVNVHGALHEFLDYGQMLIRQEP